MINKVYEATKEFIITNYKMLIVLILVIFISWYELPYAIYAPGDVVSLNNRIIVTDGYKAEGSFNMSSVSLVKGTIPLLLASYILPNWDIVSKESITINNESINELMKYERLQLKSAIANATVVAYKAADKEVNITNNVLNVISLTNKSKTNIKKYDQLKKIDGIDITSLEKLRNVLKNYKSGDIISVEVLRNNTVVNCTAELYDENDEIYIGVVLLDTFDYDVEPAIQVKTSNKEAGSSGGLMLSLAIYNTLTESDITKGRKIVGTGTIDIEGNVGEIDGVKYKLLGAVKNNADLFICPKENYEEAIKYKNELKLNIDIYSVATFDEAIELLNK